MLTENIVISLIALVLAGLRFSGVDNDFFKDIAHFFLGGLFYAAFVEYRYTWTKGGSHAMFKFWLAMALTFLVEVPAALFFHFVFKS